MMETTAKKRELKVSQMAENLIGSEIIKLAGEIREKINQGENIYNFTIGDFNPKIFPIPSEYKKAILSCYEQDETNYPEANGMLKLRQSVSKFLKQRQGVSYSENEILISGGARPIIYAIFQTLVDQGDKVLFPVPSWNNNHYSFLSHANSIALETKAENNFMPTAAEIKPHISEINMLALCSPLNPTGTVFTKEGLEEICDLVIEENKKRPEGSKPLYVMFDQIYWVLTYGGTKHFDPVSLRPEMRDYTVFVDGVSKSLAATGVRVGWAFGPARVIDKMKSILSHIGAWAPKAEQLATAIYLDNEKAVDTYLDTFKKELLERLNGFYDVFTKLKNEGFSVDAIAPQAAIYLTVKLDLTGFTTSDGKTLNTTSDVTAYILSEAKIALVPFSAFGSSVNSSWYRLSVGTSRISDIEAVHKQLKDSLVKLKK
jgi:aspartate aminotransferase